MPLHTVIMYMSVLSCDIHDACQGACAQMDLCWQEHLAYLVKNIQRNLERAVKTGIHHVIAVTIAIIQSWTDAPQWREFAGSAGAKRHCHLIVSLCFALPVHIASMCIGRFTIPKCLVLIAKMHMRSNFASTTEASLPYMLALPVPFSHARSASKIRPASEYCLILLQTLIGHQGPC